MLTVPRAPLRYVAQEEPQGCAVACLAMILGCTYAEARARIHVDTSKGITSTVYDGALVEAGFALARVYRHDPVRGVKREAWPPPPFAPIHIASTETAQGGHAVVMLVDGTVLDPWDRSRTTLRHPDYLAVHCVAGIWRVRLEGWEA